jgi:hypothetical protein
MKIGRGSKPTTGLLWKPSVVAVVADESPAVVVEAGDVRSVVSVLSVLSVLSAVDGSWK